MIGCCSRNVLITSIPHPPSDVPRRGRRQRCCWSWQAPAVARLRQSEHRQAAAAKLTANALAELGVRRLDLLERIGKAELVPLVSAHLVEAQDLDALDASEGADEVRHPLDV